MKSAKVVIMGMGYIGLPTAALIASKGINVIGVDINPIVVETINNSEIHIKEPDLEGLIKYVVKNKYLNASKCPEYANVFLIAVPTPLKKVNKPDIQFVESAINMIIPYLKEGNLIILESTCPVGTTEKIAETIFRKCPQLKNKVYISYCPERVLPGKILYELEHNDRVIGGISPESTKVALDFYSLFVKGTLYSTNSRTAEMCKLVENAYRDTNIAFANELSIICDKANIDVETLIKLANRHPRVNILASGPGVGGHCIAVDPWFIVSDFKKEAKLIAASRNVNDYKKTWVISKIKGIASEFLKKNKRKPKIACLGLAYKPNIGDIRESPALYITKKMISEGYNVLAVEPNLGHYKGIRLYDFKKAVKEADIVVFLVKHKEFSNIKMKNKSVLYFCEK
ncbi:MAG: UDP-N-acetyl-D-mannosaminuronic acid dehydrogenase [Elusimicrobia bacterium RIFOXYA2_FULL_40_6]|nr:MAG: UDP-N-acetyl-D-mannosaminuronic acid dehydrogenase [Elusimicrobia bacterium RIFOXYA2_FULL_40_6]